MVSSGFLTYGPGPLAVNVGPSVLPQSARFLRVQFVNNSADQGGALYLSGIGSSVELAECAPPDLAGRVGIRGLRC